MLLALAIRSAAASPAEEEEALPEEPAATGQAVEEFVAPEEVLTAAAARLNRPRISSPSARSRWLNS